MAPPRPPSLLCALALLAALAPRPTHGQCADDLARKVFEAGRAYYEAGDYEEALRSFKRSFDLCPKAEQLKNMGATHERMGNLPAAIEVYERYAQMVSDAEEREVTQVRIQNLKKRVEEAPPKASASVAAAPRASAPEAPAAEVTARPRPRPDRLPAVVVLGASGATALGALITGLIARSRYAEAERDCGKRCPDERVAGSYNMALVSTALTGVALVGAGAGAYLLLRRGPSASAGYLAPIVAPGAVHLAGGWSF